MTVPSALHDLAAVTEAFDDMGWEVSEVTAPDGSLVDANTVSATVRVELPVLDGLDLPENVEVTTNDDTTEDGAPLQAEFAVRIETDTSSVEARRDDGSVDSDERNAEREKTDGESGLAESHGEPDIAPSGDTDAGENPRVEASSGTADDKGERDFLRGGNSASVAVTAKSTVRDSPDTDSDPECAGTAVDDEDAESDSASATRSDVPAYRDPAKLREAYEEHDTFVEMRDALDADVTPQTVRHHMIKHGIHEPNAVSAKSDDTADGSNEQSNGEATPETRGQDGVERSASESQNDAENATTDSEDAPRGDDADEGNPNEVGSPETVSDVGTSLPEGVTVEAVRDAVASSKTLHQVREQLGTDVEETRDILQRLNLLELVTGRLASRPEREPSTDEITERIQRATRG